MAKLRASAVRGSPIKVEAVAAAAEAERFQAPQPQPRAAATTCSRFGGPIFDLSTRHADSASIGPMFALPKPGFDPETMRAVAVAYRRERQAGQLDQPARESAEAVFRARHPEFNRMPASEATAHIIAWAAREHAAWFWRGVGLAERRRP